MNSRKVELRRKQVSALLAQAVTEEEIAQKLNVDQSTISRDIKHLKVVSQKFVYDLAKSDLAFYYKQSIDGIQEVNKKAWELYRNQNNTDMKLKLLALKLVKECNEAIFSLFSQGPSIMNIKALEERLNKVENSNSSRQINQKPI
jgi:IS30 family transposase